MNDRLAARDSSNAHPELIAGRYQLERELGGGGMAVVFIARDLVAGRRVALKRPHPAKGDEERARVRQFFEREFHTLAQLAHPRIISVYDYGLDAHGPYYTMELLDGGDLQQLVPMHYPRACAIARDVCSALSLLHSRRIVHRDVSPRNIRCTADGTAKLIDFGAMAHMDATRDLVGTPAFCAPEALNLQALDGRTDLYAVGATLYYALTGRHAYAARSFAALPEVWRLGIIPPSELAPGIPAALDSLVLDLLQLSAANRPSSAAEVMERLAAVEGCPLDEQLLVAQAYLTTPLFVGRTTELASVEAKLGRALRKRGSAMLVRGAPGIGRSRFLDSCTLAAKLRGISVARAEPSAAGAGDYACVRALVAHLSQVLPDVGASSPPEVAHEASGSDPAQSREAMQNAFERVFIEAAKRGPLLIAVDDLPKIDEPSASVLALLTRDLSRAPLVVIATAAEGSKSSAAAALEMFADAALKVDLPPLDLPQTSALLESVFGPAAQRGGLSQRIFGVAQGNPRDVMRLAQDLVDRNLIRYLAGAWTVTSQFDTELPSSIAQMLQARVLELPASARRLAQAFALCPDHAFSADDCAFLAIDDSAAQRFRDLEQLTRADIVRAYAERFALADQAFRTALLQECSAAERQGLHTRLAALFEARGQVFRVAQHLLRAGEQIRALDMLVEHAIASQRETDRDPAAFATFMRSLPADWLDTFEEGIELCERLGRPLRHAFVLRNRLIGLMAVIGMRETRHISVVVAQLKAASGLDDWGLLSDVEPPLERLKLALERAQARYDAASDQERIVDPASAIRLLAGSVQAAVGTSAPLLDLAGVRAVPALAPFAALSPAVFVLDTLVQGVEARLANRLDLARELYRGLIERLAAPDRAGLPASHHRHTSIRVMNGLAMIEAFMGLASSLQWADKIEADPLYRVHACLVRTIYQLWQGRLEERDRLQEELEVLRLRNISAQSIEHTYLLWEIAGCAQLDDLTRIKRAMSDIERAASDHPGWRPVRVYAEAEYQRVRGDAASAAALLARELGGLRAGEHQLWSNLAAAQVRALEESGAIEQAVALGTGYLGEAERAELGFGANVLLLALCTAEAKLGRVELAVQHAERAIRSLERLGTTGLHVALAYEARTRVALAVGDRPIAELYLERFERLLDPGGSPALASKFQKLLRDSQRRTSETIAPSATPASFGLTSTVLRDSIRNCSHAMQRAEVSLAYLAEKSGVQRAYLFFATDADPKCVATLGAPAPSQAMTAAVREYLVAALGSGDVSTGESRDTTSLSEHWNSFLESTARPVLLSHYVGDQCIITGLAVLVVESRGVFTYPAEAAAQLSRVLYEAGDVTGVSAGD
jgi:Protein kinase domain/AAA ATPase domain